MLTLIGTGHVFNIGDSVSQIARCCWPDAVCVELDEMRYHALTGDREALEEDMRKRGIDPGTAKSQQSRKESAIYKKNKSYQEGVAKQNGSRPGADMIAAIGVAKSLGVPVFCVDNDARETFDRMWDEMGTGERLRYRFSGISDRIGGKRKVDRTQADYYDDEAKYLEEFRRKYPVMTRVLIDERNEAMAERIAKVARTHERTVAVVGDGHMNGLIDLLPADIEKRTVRLHDLTDPERLNALKKQYWETNE